MPRLHRRMASATSKGSLIVSRSKLTALRQDVAACCAFGVLWGEKPTDEQIALMETHGYWRDGRLTDEGEAAAADASGYTE